VPALVAVQAATSQVLFEGEFSEAELEEIGVADRVEDVVKATDARLSTVADTIRACASDLLATFDDLATQRRPGGSFTGAVIQLGVKVTGEGNVIIARGSAEANLSVTLNWDFA
jgi:hypothetical protein